MLPFLICQLLIMLHFRFKSTLPEQCNMLRTKVFPVSPFSGSDLDLSDSDGGTAAKSKALAKSKSRAKEGKSKTAQLERTRSLSVTLQEEMDQRRSRSLSIGPGGDGMKKRALAREVSMSVAFKGKASAKTTGRGGIGRSQSRLIHKTKVKAEEEEQGQSKKRLGTTLVAATPSKPRKYDKFASSQPSLSKSFSQSLAASSSQTQGQGQGWLAQLGSQTRLFVDDAGGDTDIEDDDAVVAPCTPTPKSNGRALHRKKANSLEAVEGDGDDDAWIVQSSPDILLLGEDEVWEHTVTPRKKRRGS